MQLVCERERKTKRNITQIVELSYQRTKKMDKLSFLYLLEGNETNLRKMLAISQLQKDPLMRFQNAVYLGDVQERIQLLKDVGQLPLAYMTAKTHGLTEEAESILVAAGKTEEEIELPEMPEQLPATPKPITQLEDPNWPLLTVSKSFFEGAFAQQQQQQQTQQQGLNANVSSMKASSFSYDDQIDNIEEAGGDWGDDDDLGINTSSKAAARDIDNDLLGGNPDEDEDDLNGDGGWDDDDDIKAELDAEMGHVAAKETAEFVAPTEGVSENSLWAQNSGVAADHIAAGAFDSAMQILNRQKGIVKFEPLKSHFLAIYQASRVSVSGLPNTPSVNYNLRRNPETSNPRNSLPVAVYDFQTIVTTQLQTAYRLFTSGKLVAAAQQFKLLLHSVLFTVTSNDGEANELVQLIDICREYLLGLSMEQTRRSITGQTPEDMKRALELAAYFAHCHLQTPHMQLALRQATKQAFRTKNFSTASQFASRLLELAPPRTVADEVKILIFF
jgi:coatomer protein complex subunit alpha (xenin)